MAKGDKMSQRSLFLLGIIFLILVGGYIYTQHSKEAGLKSILTKIGKKTWLESDKLEVFYDHKKGFSIIKQGSKWIIQDEFPKPANTIKIQDFLKELSELTGEKRASGEKFFPRFKLSEEEALHLKLYKNQKELAHLLIGKRGPQWASSFVRLKGNNAIYLVPINLLAKFEIWSVEPQNPKAKDFVDLQVAQVSKTELKHLSFMSKKIHWELVRQEEKNQKNKFLFIKEKKKKILSKKDTEKFLLRLFPIYARDIIAPTKFKEKATLTLETRLGQKEIITFGPCYKKKKEETCVLEKNGYVYKVDKSYVKPFFNPQP